MSPERQACAPAPKRGGTANHVDWEARAERLLRTTSRVLRAAQPPAPLETVALADGAPAIESSAPQMALPWVGQWCCSRCGATVAGTLDLHEQPTARRLTIMCTSCGVQRETLALPAIRAKRGETGSLPLVIQCRCPECGGALPGRAFTRQGVVWVEMTCPTHGYTRDRIETDPHLFLELLASERPDPGPSGPALNVVALDPDDARGVHGKGVAAALDHARESGERVCLTTTINRALNRDQIGPLFEFAVENVDAIAALLYQPVTFPECVSLQQLADQRYTLGELARALAERSGADVGRDFMPLGRLAPIPAALGLARQHATIVRAAAGRWSVGAYFVVGAGRRATALGRVFHLPRLLDVAADAAARLARLGAARRLAFLDRARLVLRLGGCVRRVTRETRWLPLTLFRAWRVLTEAEPVANAPRLLLVAGVQPPDRYRFALPR